jgi:hypothetical protein
LLKIHTQNNVPKLRFQESNLLIPNTYSCLQAGRDSQKVYYNFKSLISFFKLVCAIAFLSNVHGQSPSIYTSSGTWTCPAGVTSVTVEAWGGGGSGKLLPQPKVTLVVVVVVAHIQSEIQLRSQ